MRFLFPCVIASLLLAPVSLGQTVVDLPEDLASSGNDGVGGIESKPPGNVPLGQVPGVPAKPAQPKLTDTTTPPAPEPEGGDDLEHLAGTQHDLGGSLAGSGGFPRAEPVLNGQGDLAALSLSQSAPQTPVVLVLGVSAIHLPFKGGTMIPAPDLLVSLGATDALGRLEVPAFWPGDVPSCIPVLVQCWMADPLGPEGMAASNALMLVSP